MTINSMDVAEDKLIFNLGGKYWDMPMGHKYPRSLLRNFGGDQGT